MFNATEAVDEIIEEINGEATYEAVLDELTERVESGELTLEEAQVVSEMAYGKYVVEKEGSATDILSKVKKAKKVYKDAIKETRKAKKGNGDIKKALANIKQAKAVITETEKYIDKCPNTISSIMADKVLTVLAAGAIGAAVDTAFDHAKKVNIGEGRAQRYAHNARSTVIIKTGIDMYKGNKRYNDGKDDSRLDYTNTWKRNAMSSLSTMYLNLCNFEDRLNDK